MALPLRGNPLSKRKHVLFAMRGQDARPFVRRGGLGRGICILVASLLGTNP